MKKKKILPFLLSFCMLLGLLLMPVRIAQASSTANANDAILEARKGILQVAAMVKVDGNELFYLHVGTGFLVGGDDGAQTVITNFHVAHALDEANARAMAQEHYGVGENAKVELELRIIVKRDVLIGATIVNESQKADFSILKLSQPIYDRTPLTLADSNGVVTTQEVFALGFPGIVQDIQTDGIYTSEDVTVTSGIVSKTSDVTLLDVPIPCITHSARLAEGNSGGPLLNKNGDVIGVNTIISNDQNNNNDYFFSTQITEVREVLDALGIEYKSVGGGDGAEAPQQPSDAEVPEETTAPAETLAPETEAAVNPLLDDLKAAIDAANAVSFENMTEESIDNFKNALNAAEAVYRNTGASDSEIQKAITDLQTAQNGLVEAKGMDSMMIIIISGAAIVVVIIIVIIIIAVTSSKKKKAAAQKLVNRPGSSKTQGRPGTGNGPVPGMPGGASGNGPQNGWNPQQPQNGFQPTPPFVNPAPYNAGSDGSAETSVLNDGAGETTLLSGGANLPAAYLMRKKNNERITLTKQVFKIGKERRRVDYCISDNSNVSRSHADIVFKSGAFYIVDNNATNGTTVNGTSVGGGQERKLMNGDVIKLADEEFKFQQN